MKVLIVISALISIAYAGIAPIVIYPSATPFLRPDSAFVRSERLGDNFAYYFAEGQAFQTVSPYISSNVRALDTLGVSYAINPISVIGTPSTQFIFHQPTSEEEQREQQRIKDLWQQQQDQLQQEGDRLREEEERRILAIQQLQHDRPNEVLITVPIDQSQYQPVAVGIPPTQPGPIATVPVEPQQPIEVATDPQTIANENGADNSAGSGELSRPIVTDDAVVIEAKSAEEAKTEDGESATENAAN